MCISTLPPRPQQGHSDLMGETQVWLGAPKGKRQRWAETGETWRPQAQRGRAASPFSHVRIQGATSSTWLWGVQTGLGGREGGKAEPCGRARLEPQTCRGLTGASVSPPQRCWMKEGKKRDEREREGEGGGWRGGSRDGSGGLEEEEEEEGLWERLGPAGGGRSGLT